MSSDPFYDQFYRALKSSNDKREAKARGESLSEVLREALRRYVGRVK